MPDLIHEAVRRSIQRVATLIVSDYEGDDQRSSVVDMLTDVRHLCEQEGIDFKAALTMSNMHFEAEQAGEA